MNGHIAAVLSFVAQIHLKFAFDVSFNSSLHVPSSSKSYTAVNALKTNVGIVGNRIGQLNVIFLQDIFLKGVLQLSKQ